MATITEHELQMLEEAETSDDWNRICSAIKKKHGGKWPSDWAEKVLFGNLKSKIDVNLHVSVDNKAFQPTSECG